MKILVVDDDESVLQILERTLALAGKTEVVTAMSGAAALDAISQQDAPFDCLLVDIQMPELDGVTLIKMVRQTPGYGGTAIVMLTAMQDKEHLDAAFAAGATDFVTKPFDFVDLRQRILDAYATSRRKVDLQDHTMMEGELKKMGGEVKDFRLEDPISVGGNAKEINDREFENYLIELTRRKPRRMTVFAAKIHDAQHVYMNCSSDGFVEILEEVASAIGDILLGEHGLMTYRGNGVFLCVDEGGPKPAERQFHSELTNRLRARQGPGSRVQVRVLVGNRIPLALSSKMDAIESLSNAVNAAQDLDLASSSGLGFTARLLGRRHLSNEQDRLDQRAFAHLLKDTLPTVQNDDWAQKLKKRARRG